MAVLIVTSGPGAPGVTTTALGLALTWPRDSLLADCDREPAQAILAGYLRGADHGGRGLAALSRVQRTGDALAPEMWRHTVALTEQDRFQRRFLPGFSVPGTVRLFDQVWPELADAFAQLDAHGVDVVIDAGCVGRDGLPTSLLASADAVIFVTRSGLRSLASTRLYLPVLAEQLDALPSPPSLGLVLVGPDQPYSSGEISAQFGVSCWADIPWHERAAGVLSDGDNEPRRFHSGSFLSSLRATASRLSERISHDRDASRRLVMRDAHVHR